MQLGRRVRVAKGISVKAVDKEHGTVAPTALKIGGNALKGKLLNTTSM